jgi:flagellar brake protein
MAEASEQAESDIAAPRDLDGVEESPYLLHSRIDIAAVLRDVVRTRELVSVHFGSSQDTLLTPLLCIEPGAEEVVFDCSGSERVNRALLLASKLLFVASHGEVKIRFTTGPARQGRHDGADAFCVRMPQSMLRLQRREFYRVLAPVARPVRCAVPLVQGGQTRHIETRLHDISQGGVALIAQPGDLPNEIGAVYERCRIVLPDASNVMVTLQTRNLSMLTLLNGRSAVRIGCQFVRPDMPALALIHRYMMRLESEKKART